MGRRRAGGLQRIISRREAGKLTFEQSVDDRVEVYLGRRVRHVERSVAAAGQS